MQYIPISLLLKREDTSRTNGKKSPGAAQFKKLADFWRSL